MKRSRSSAHSLTAVRLLLDECVPRRFLAALSDPESRHIVDMGWRGVKNGELLRLAFAEAGQVYIAEC